MSSWVRNGLNILCFSKNLSGGEILIFVPDVRLTDWSRPEVTDILARDLWVTVHFATDILRESAQSVTGGVIVTEIEQLFNELY